jgi:hypothetical protein
VAKQPAKGRKTPAKAKQSPAAGAKPDESPVLLIDTIPPEVHQPVTEKPALKTPPKPAEEPKAVEKSAEPTPPAVKPAPEPKQQSGFIPLVLGGLIAGVIGFGVASLTTPASDGPLAEQVASQSATIASLEQQIAALASAPAPVTDLSGIEASQTAMASDIARLDTELVALGEQLSNLRTLPTTDGGTMPSPDLAAYEAEIDALRAQMQEQIVAMTQTAQSQLEEARAEATAIEENAAARHAAGRAALARVQTGLESGAPLGAALDDLELATGEQLPDALATARDGVPTLASLQETFPDAARASLATARSEGVAGEETSGFGAFLRNQLDFRSVAPREGNDVDAILSRAEAAVKAGRLSDALAELAALPEVARAEMSGWLSQAEARASAVTAVDMLATSLNDN